MSELAATPPPGPADPVSQTGFIMWRVQQLEAKYAQLDQQGSRGVTELRLEVRQLAKEFGEHEEQHKQARKDQATSRRWLVGIVVALITPLYPLLFVLLRLKGA